MPALLPKSALSTVLLLASSPATHAFTSTRTTKSQRKPSLLTLELNPQTRRKFGLTFLATTAATTLLSPIEPSNAVVYADPDRYGDKELKIATVNKLRQNIRDAILQNPAFAPLFLKIAIQDALTYDNETGEYGPDGSVLGLILSPDAPASLIGLRPAAQKLFDISVKIKKTTEITIADVVSFAGAEAIETAGGPRIVLQLGKLDPKKSGGGRKLSYVDLCDENGGSKVIAAFLKAGLTEREVALLYGAIADMESVALAFKKDEVEEEENEMGDTSIFIPSSFGAPSEIYGQRIGKMTGDIYKDITKDLKKKQKPIADVFVDDRVGSWASKYAAKPAGFLKDLPEAYAKMDGLGLRFTGGKMANLLGGSDPSY